MDIRVDWEDRWKPLVVQKPIHRSPLIAEILEMSVTSLEARIRAEVYPFAKYFKLDDEGGRGKYEIYSLQFIEWYEGHRQVDADLIGVSVFNRFLAYMKEAKIF